MKASKVTPTVGIRKSNTLRAAKKGAVSTAVAYTAASAITWVAQPKHMQHVVNQYGGIKNYAKGFAMGVAVVSVIGALFNGALNIVINKIHGNKNPKAN